MYTTSYGSILHDQKNEHFMQEAILEFYPQLIQRVSLKTWIANHISQAQEPSDGEYNQLMNDFESTKLKIEKIPAFA